MFGDRWQEQDRPEQAQSLEKKIVLLEKVIMAMEKEDEARQVKEGFLKQGDDDSEDEQVEAETDVKKIGKKNLKLKEYMNTVKENV